MKSRSALLFAGIASGLAGMSAPASAQNAVGLTLKTLTAQMKFDQSELRVPAGSTVKLLFDNPDDMPHNVVFCTPGTNVDDVVAKMLASPEKAMKNGFLPDDDRVWLKSRLLNPHETQSLEFKAPDKPGSYPFVCSFPGHAPTMRGILRVMAEGPKLTDLHFALYHGAWTTLPNFEKLTPHRTGEVADNIIQLKFDDYKNQYGLVFTGKLEAPEDGTYTFQIASDDGSRLSVDGQKVVTHDGIHPAEVKEGTAKLKKGAHAFRLEYFQAEGGADLYAGWSGPNFDTVSLSKWQPANARKGKGQQKKEDFTGILLSPNQEPIIYRNFIANAGNRGIGVGFPGGLNLAWSAETMNLSLIWRGAFVDAARHWKNRGGGHQPPAGFDVYQPASTLLPLAVQDPAAEKKDWPGFQNELTQEGYQWKGYSLDVHGIPSFEYAWNGVAVADKLTPKGDYKTDAKLIRTVKLAGKIPPHASFLLAKGADIKLQAGSFVIKSSPADSGFTVTCDGATIERSGDKMLLVVPAREEIRATYSWASSASHNTHVAP